MGKFKKNDKVLTINLNSAHLVEDYSATYLPERAIGNIGTVRVDCGDDLYEVSNANADEFYCSVYHADELELYPDGSDVLFEWLGGNCIGKKS